MQHTFKVSFCFLLLLVATSTAWSQQGNTDRINAELQRGPSPEAIMKAANKAQAEGDYYSAMVYNKYILDIDSMNIPARRGYAKAAVDFFAYEEGEKNYQILVDRQFIGPDGTVLKELADVKYRLGKYEEAHLLYDQFLTAQTPERASDAVRKDAENQKSNCDWALDMLDNADMEVYIADLDSSVNTGYSEFSPYLLENKLYFSSYRFLLDHDRHNPKRHQIKILEAVPGTYAFETTVAPYNEKTKHTAHATFSEDGKIMYHTICSFVEKTVNITCEIYRRILQTDGSWGPAYKLPAQVNQPEFTATEPCVGRVPGVQGDVLYFVSDRPGGKGERDIWYSKINQDSFETAINLADINTAGDDVTPFFHYPGSTLYFSTTGMRSLGGFDIYKVMLRDNRWMDIENMGAVLNSGANDVYYTMTPDSKMAFLSSNRNGAQNLSEEACCYDIFKADLVRPEMVAITFNKASGDSLYTTSMRLIELNDDGSVAEEIKVNVPGSYFAFPLLPGKKYMLIAEKDKFASDTVYFETPRTIWKEQIVQKLYLEPSHVKLIVRVFDKDTKEPILGATSKFAEKVPGVALLEFQLAVKDNENRYDYDLDFDRQYKILASKPGYTTDSVEVTTAGLLGNAVIEKTLYLQKGINFKALVYNSLNNDTLHGVTFTLVEVEGGNRTYSHTSVHDNKYETTVFYDRRYRIIASKPDYSSDSLEFTTKDLPRIAFQSITRELYLHPLNLSAYLPIQLFFDNDEPDKRTLAQSTKKEYRESYVTYYRKKQEFYDRFILGLPKEEIETAYNNYDNFFEGEIRGGWTRLMTFSEVLYEMLQRGDKIRITLRGFASPRAASSYNLNLTARRVSSVINHFSIFDGGIYKPYVESGQLIIVEELNGEKLAPKDINDKINEERNSIYSIPASRERRVEIIGVEVSRKPGT